MSNNTQSNQSDGNTLTSQDSLSSVLSEETLAESFPEYDGQITSPKSQHRPRQRKQSCRNH
jgi:hypothetical protein